MYLLFRYHNIMPGQFKEMGAGQQQIVHAFMNFEMQQRQKEIESIKEE